MNQQRRGQKPREARVSVDTCTFGCQKNSMNQKEDSSYYSYWFDFVAFGGTLSCCNVTVNFPI